MNHAEITVNEDNAAEVRRDTTSKFYGVFQMSKKYVPGHVIDECNDLRRKGKTIEFLAGRIGGIEAAELAELLGESVRPVQTQSTEVDLWAVDRANAIL